MRTDPTIAESGRIYLKKKQDRRVFVACLQALETPTIRRFPKIRNYASVTLDRCLWRFRWYRRRRTLARLDELTRS